MILGEIYNEVEQLSDSVRSYEAALESLSMLSPLESFQYCQYFLVVNNMLGLSYINRDQNEEGLGCFGKAMTIY